ncbi:hypothetical protein TELCIR_03085, partial [Teladorsagia circumcincta]
MIDVGPPTHIPLQQAIIYDDVVENGMYDDMYDVNLPKEDTSDGRVRVLIDPKPPEKVRLTYDEYYDRKVSKNMQEMEVNAATIEMAAPVRQSNRPNGARNVDWVIDAVAR